MTEFPAVAELEVRPGLWVATRTCGSGPPLVCVPGGPGRASDYLDELGGLDRDATLVTVDLPGVGRARAPSKPSGYQVPALVDAVRAVLTNLGLGPVAVLGHSAGVITAALVARQHPELVSRLILLAPGGRQLGLSYDDAEQARAARSAEPWYAEAVATDDWTPFFYGRWDDAARAHAAREDEQFSDPAADGFGIGDLDADQLRAELATLDLPTLVVRGSLDPLGQAIGRQWAELVPGAELVTLPGAAHYPWIDDPVAVRATISAFLA